MAQRKQSQWHTQWTKFQDNERFLFDDWIKPNSIDDFRDKVVLEAGCGGGQHTSFIAPYCERIVSVDLNSVDIASERNKAFDHVQFVEDDISEMKLKERFDIVVSIGVVHHTDDPDKTVRNLVDHLASGGRLILWVYSKEGNWISERVIERFRKKFLHNASHTSLLVLSNVLTCFLYLPVFTIYLLPLRFLPYYEYFSNFRQLSFRRNTLNVYDKLNAPQVEFISEDRIRDWLSDKRLTEIHFDRYKGVSWRVSATRSGKLALD